MLTVFIDPAAASSVCLREQFQKVCSDIGVQCDFVPQAVERTISWIAPMNATESARHDIEKDLLAVLSTEETISMIDAYLKKKQNPCEDKKLTLTEWVESVQLAMPEKHLTVLIVGLFKYFSNQKLNAKRKYREAVTGQPTRAKKKKSETELKISYQEAEEAFVEVQLVTGCIVQHVDTEEELAQQIKMYTKAIADKPNKKDRFNNIFSFMEEGPGGLSVSKNGEGLAKVWKHQLLQFKNFGPDMADAIVSNYPSPMSFHEACNECNTLTDAERIIGDINVRRGAGVIATNRRIGKEQSRRLHTFMTSTNPNIILK